MFLMNFVKLNYIIITIILDIFSLFTLHFLLNSNPTKFRSEYFKYCKILTFNILLDYLFIYTADFKNKYEYKEYSV